MIHSSQFESIYIFPEAFHCGFNQTKLYVCFFSNCLAQELKNLCLPLKCIGSITKSFILFNKTYTCYLRKYHKRKCKRPHQNSTKLFICQKQFDNPKWQILSTYITDMRTKITKKKKFKSNICYSRNLKITAIFWSHLVYYTLKICPLDSVFYISFKPNKLILFQLKYSLFLLNFFIFIFF